MARNLDPANRRDIVPGCYASKRESHEREIERGDMRGLGLSPAEREAINGHPNSTVSAARAALARIDAGEPVVTWLPSLRQFPVAAEIPWLADRSVSQVRVWPDDTIEHA